MAVDEELRLAHRALVRNIQVRRKRAGMSVEQLAGLAVVSRAQTYRVLRSESNPTLRWMVRIALALDCEPGDLLGGQ